MKNEEINDKRETEKNRLQLIPKCEEYIQYSIEMINKLPRIEKFNIGNEYKKMMYKLLENIMYIQKMHVINWITYLNKIDALLNIQRCYLRVMYKNRYIDNKKFNVSIRYISEMGQILGELFKYYAKNNKK